MDAVRTINTFATGGLVPDLTLFIDIPVDEIEQRRAAAGKGLDRMEAAGREFFQRVRDGYTALADCRTTAVRAYRRHAHTTRGSREHHDRRQSIAIVSRTHRLKRDRMNAAKEQRKPEQRIAAAGIIVAALLFTGFMMAPDSDMLLKISKSIDVFGRVYKEVATSYVDEIDPEKFMEAGIEGMLGTLDPYTVYIDKEDGDEVDLMTSGKYGGIGVTIGARDGAVRVISVMDGYSAQRQGIVPGDRFIEISGTKVDGLKPDEIRGLTRGDPGSEVKVLIERDGEAKPLEFVLIREEIQVKNITYSGMLPDGIGYVRLERFSRRAGDELRQAIKELKLNGEVRGFVLDLRGNPGGLLDAAVEVVSKFVPRGSMVVSTRGRRPESDKKYASTEEPLLPSVPLVVLTDRNSASASEIVAGSLQDMDRALIVGTRSFGKGLVQTIVPLNYGAQLKITTARYYIPSGRSIQEIDYMHRDRNGVFAVTPDSLRREFKTVHGTESVRTRRHRTGLGRGIPSDRTDGA